MKAIIYCRVSTDDQEKEGTSLKTQLESCRNYCDEKGYFISKEFSETYSGLTLDRPKLTELRDLLLTREIDIIVIYCLDRISRDPTHGVILSQEFEKLNVKLESVTETIESTDLGNLISYIRGFASKLEAEKIRERTMRGKLAHLKQGKLPQGTGKGPYGYSWNKETGKRVIIDHEAEAVKKMYKLIISGESLSSIASILNKDHIPTKAGLLWCHSAIKRTITNSLYCGKTYYGNTKRISKTQIRLQPKENRILLPDITPPIVSENIFNLAQESLKEAKIRRPLETHAPYLFTGFIKCSKCGSPICGHTLQKKYRYYRCRGTMPTSTRGTICNASYIKCDDFDQSIWNKLSEIITSPLSLLSMATDMKIYKMTNESKLKKTNELLDNQIKQLKNKLKTYSIKEKNLYELLSHDNVTKDYVLDTINNLKKEKLKDEQELEKLLSTKIDFDNANGRYLTLNEASELIKALMASKDIDFEQKRSLLQILKVKITSDSKNHNFTFTLGGETMSVDDKMDFKVVSLFNDMLKDFQLVHPDISFKDLLSYSKPLPEDTEFGIYYNQVIKKILSKNNLSPLNEHGHHDVYVIIRANGLYHTGT